MSDLVLYNTLTARKEPFEPITKGKVGVYVCGITPYDESHLGHARCYVVFDVLRRVLRANGYEVRHIQNFTDVDDKIIKRAAEKNVPAESYPKPFMESFKNIMAQLNVLPPDEYPLVTTHMKEIIALIEKLVARGFAYPLDGDVYYSVRKFGDDYVKLSKRKLEDLESGARVEVDERKKDPLDFALWKAAKPGEPSWGSPWGKGRPGWHIECSAMSMKYLGETFDIHGGGLDLIFPHHTNEIAQSEGATGKKFAKIWMHNGFVTVNEEKMSKSLGNFFTMRDILAKFDPMVVRYFLLSVHYRSPLNFSDQDLKSAETVWRNRICGAYQIVESREHSSGEPQDFSESREVKRELPHLIKSAAAGLNDDLNTPEALAALNDYCTIIFALDKDSGEKRWDASVTRVMKRELDSLTEKLGLKVPSGEALDGEVRDLLQQREEARQKKDWARSDQIRDRLKAKGLVVEDTPAGPRVKKIQAGVS